jgi:hypothetical protein
MHMAAEHDNCCVVEAMRVYLAEYMMDLPCSALQQLVRTMGQLGKDDWM